MLDFISKESIDFLDYLNGLGMLAFSTPFLKKLSNCGPYLIFWRSIVSILFDFLWFTIVGLSWFEILSFSFSNTCDLYNLSLCLYFFFMSLTSFLNLRLYLKNLGMYIISPSKSNGVYSTLGTGNRIEFNSIIYLLKIL